MYTNFTIGLMVLFAAGCADGQAESSTRTALSSATRSSTTTAADTSHTTTRRVLPKPPGIHAAPMPDGRRIVEVLDSTGDLAVQDLVTGQLRLLTHNAKPWDPGYAWSPRVSRDGKHVAYAWSDNETGLLSLRVIDAAGGESKTIVAAQEASPFIAPADWSADGQWVLAVRVMEDRTNQIVLVPANSGPMRVLKSLDWRWPLGLNLSPDGRFVVYGGFPKDASNNGDIYTLAVDGSRETRVVESAASEEVLGWAPDGKHILYTSDRDGAPGAWLLPVADGKSRGNPVLIKSQLWRASPAGFTANGAFFYNVGTGGLHVYTAIIDSATGKLVSKPSPITSTPLAKTTYLDWSPDGRLIAYQIQNDRRGAIIIAIRSVQSGETREIALPVHVQNIFQMRWLRDGSAILIRGHAKGQSGLLRLNVRTGKVDEILGHAVTPFELTPDGSSVVYRRLADSVTAILVRNLTSGAERVLHRHPGVGTNWWMMSVSPDGAELAFFRRIADSQHELMTMPIRGGEPRRVTVLDGERVKSMAWTKDGRSILFEKQDEKSDTSRVWRVAATGGDPEPVGLAMERLTQIALSPDGRHLAFAAGIGRTELWVMEHFLPR